jgi:formiminotetrahydrofolate cyclodeaminase
MNVEELVKKVSDSYNQEIKPLIVKKREYNDARMRFANYVDAMNEHLDEITRRIHCGGNFVAAANCLYEALKSATEPPVEDMKKFEIFLAQTKLPKESDQNQ